MRFDPYAADPQAHAHLSGLAVHLARGPLDHGVKSLVELRASQINGCAFCLDLHATLARHAHVPQEKLDTLAGWREAPVFDERERAGLALTEEMVRVGDGTRVAEATWQDARRHFSDDEIAALLYTIALVALWNVLNVAVELPARTPLPSVT